MLTRAEAGDRGAPYRGSGTEGLKRRKPAPANRSGSRRLTKRDSLTPMSIGRGGERGGARIKFDCRDCRTQSLSCSAGGGQCWNYRFGRSE
ncbi:hypothetical protein D3C87_1719180 [compost metagenome]